MSTKRVMPAVAGLTAAMLWVLPVAAADAPGTMPGDEAMTCQQIAAELTPYMQQMMPGVMALAKTAQDVRERGEQRVAEEVPAATALTAAATASHADPTGMAANAVGQAEAVRQHDAWQRSMIEDKPLRDQYSAQAGQVVAQGQQMQSNVRLQRLMQLVGEKRCDSR